MFFIVNKTKKTIAISDLKITLGPHQAVDLDRMMGRERSDYSKDLKAATRKGDVLIKRRDEVGKVKLKEEKQDGKDILAKMKEDILKEVREGLKEVGKEIRDSKTEGGISKEDLVEVMKGIMANMPKASETVIMKEVEKVVANDIGVEIDQGLLADIHARAVNEMVKESEIGEIDYKKEKIVSDIDSKVDELENLLG